MDEFSTLVGEIYDVIIDPAKWNHALGLIADFVEASRVTLILEDAVEPGKSVFYQSYSDPEWTQLYLTTYLPLNPMRIATGVTAQSGDVILTSDFMTPEEYRRSRFSQEFLSARAMSDIAVAVLEKTATTITVLSVLLSEEQGFAGSAMRRKLELIAPHVKRAAAIGRAFEHRRIEAATFAQTLDGLSGAVFLLDAAGTIVHANDSAERLLARGDVLRRSEDRLVPARAAARTALTQALTAIGDGEAVPGSGGTLIKLVAEDHTIFFGTIMPLDRGLRRRAAARSRAVAVFCVREAESRFTSVAGDLAELYALSPRETTVLVAIVEEGGVPAVAATLGLSKDTIRTHLQSIFRKTGARRQSDLVKLFANARSPFAEPSE